MARFFILISLFSLFTFWHPEAAAPPIFELKKSGSSVWHNNDLINMNVSDDGSRVRAVLSRKLSLGFVCGFYSIDNISYLFSVIVIGGGNPAVVWSANRDHPVRENATLQLIPQGGLVLRDSDGSQVWSTNNTSGKSVAGMNMTALGNLVLFNDKGVIVWQSFDSPTDTLLSGQRFYEGKQLISSTSPTNWSRGLYYATLTMDLGLTAFIRDGEGQKPQMYYQMEPNQSSIDQISLTATGHCRLLRNNQVNSSSRNSDGSNYADLQTGGFLVNLGTTSSQAQQQQQPLDSVIEYVRLNSDGSLKLYRYDNNSSRSSEIVDMVGQDLGACQYPRLCGDYGLCKAGKCSCPQGDDGIQYFHNGHSSSVIASENSINYSLRIIKPILNGQASEIEVRKDAEEEFVDRVQAALRKTVWHTGCGNWYERGAKGQEWNGSTYPWPQVWFWYDCLFPKWRHLEYSGPSDPGGSFRRRFGTYSTLMVMSVLAAGAWTWKSKLASR